MIRRGQGNQTTCLLERLVCVLPIISLRSSQLCGLKFSSPPARFSRSVGVRPGNVPSSVSSAMLIVDR